jgi:hypothetical protein
LAKTAGAAFFNEWIEIPNNNPGNRKDGALAVLRDYVVVWGGMNKPNGALHVMNANTNQWKVHGDLLYQPKPRLMVELMSVTEVECAATFLRSICWGGGRVYSFGYGAEGQLGNGVLTITPTEITALNGKSITGCTAGSSHSICWGDGRVYSFGAGQHGQLGHGGDAADKDQPTEITALIGKSITGCTAGSSHSICWGGGRVYSFGAGQHGQLGHGDAADKVTPTEIAALIGKSISGCTVGEGGPETDSNGLAQRHSICWGHGRVYSFGCGKSFQLGHVDMLGPTLARKSFAYALSPKAGEQVLYVHGGISSDGSHSGRIFDGQFWALDLSHYNGESVNMFWESLPGYDNDGKNAVSVDKEAQAYGHGISAPRRRSS